MKKKVLSIVLTIMTLTVLLTGCGKTKDKETTDTKTSSNKVTDTPSTDGKDPAQTEEANIDISEPVTLTWFLNGNSVSDDKAVLEKANEYLKEKLNVTLKPIWGTWGNFEDNVVLSISGGDDVDIYFTSSWTQNEYNKYAKDGAWLRLDREDNNLIEKYAPDAWNMLPDILKNSAKVPGSDGEGVYALPGFKDYATQNCWDVNVTLLEKYGYTIDDIRNTDYYGFEEILKKVKEGEGKDFYPLLVEGMVLERMVNNSIMVTGDSQACNMLSYYINPTDVSKEGSYGNKIFGKFETPEYKKFVEKTREYYLAGYIDPQMAIADQANDARTAAQDAGKYLIGTQSYSLGYETQASARRGIEVQMVPCTPAYVDTTASQGAMMAISATSKNPERALMFLNLLNTDPELMTLLNFGIEGTHYEVVNGGEVKFITEARGTYQPWTNGMGNVTILPPQEGQGLNFYDTFKEYYASATAIPINGFVFDQSNVETEMAALANVGGEYALALNTGAIDPATKLPEFIQKLKDNGIDKVVDEAGTQLEKFLEEKNK
ncbi:ABC transporter substrate-binding protein [Anaerocolumna aminovalerica]|jgi:putative aldouronate transport system substrate-binding protein|uniref:ABC transporter substrate-binding protein n=1 Tax=Anaerocolumna aminovalerica TaxID=1527 RepID=UPI00248D1EEE|nr:ABC transporter substrate-binding protein [Anaerocolumna aminovalerica]